MNALYVEDQRDTMYVCSSVAKKGDVIPHLPISALSLQRCHLMVCLARRLVWNFRKRGEIAGFRSWHER